jgi:beta-galactosidase
VEKLLPALLVLPICFALAVLRVSGAEGAAAAEPPADITQFNPGMAWPDTDGNHINCHGGGILYESNTIYWFGELRGGRGLLPCVSVFTSKDLYHWKNEGAALTRSEDTNTDLTRGCAVERPKVLHNPRTGKYVMWFHLELAGRGYNAARAAVAVSDKVTGPYQYLTSFRPNGNMSRDMDLFVDDDGKAYHIYSARDNYDMRICQLSEDFLSSTTNDVLIASDHREGPAIFKSQGTYYLITSACTGWAPNAANYYTANRIMGPWTSHPNPCAGPKAATTFDGQSTYVLPVPGKAGAFIFMADRWNQRNLQSSGHIWLPVQIKGNELTIEWMDHWDLSWFDKKAG